MAHRTSLVLILTYLLLNAVSVLSLEWPTIAGWQLTRVGQQATAPNSAEMVPAEIEAVIQNMESLDAFNQRPDCFRQAAKGIRARCDELEMDEEARIRAAISMTLCELATAQHHSPPLECHPFTDSETSASSSASYSHCVEAFSRSAQFWSSYSGYLRQIPQLCFAYRRWNDIDTAKNLYYNATVEKLAFLKLLRRREGVVAKQEEALTGSLKELVETARRLETGAGDLEAHTQHLKENGSQMIIQIASHLAESVHQAEQRFQASHRSFDEELANILAKSEDVHATQLRDVIQDVQVLLESNAKDVMRIMRDNTGVLAGATVTLQREWNVLGQSMSMISQAINTLNGATERIAVELNSHAIQAAETRDLQSTASEALSSLVSSIYSLSDFAHAQIEAINATSIAVRNEMLMQQDSLEWWTALIMRVLRMSGQFDTTDMDAVMSHPWLKILAQALSTLWQIAKWLVYPLASAVVLPLIKAYTKPRRLARTPTDSTLSSGSDSNIPANKAHHRPSRLQLDPDNAAYSPISSSVKPSPVTPNFVRTDLPKNRHEEAEEEEEEDDALGPLSINLPASLRSNGNSPSGRAASEPPVRAGAMWNGKPPPSVTLRRSSRVSSSGAR